MEDHLLCPTALQQQSQGVSPNPWALCVGTRLHCLLVSLEGCPRSLASHPLFLVLIFPSLLRSWFLWKASLRAPHTGLHLNKALLLCPTSRAEEQGLAGWPASGSRGVVAKGREGESQGPTVWRREPVLRGMAKGREEMGPWEPLEGKQNLQSCLFHCNCKVEKKKG